MRSAVPIAVYILSITWLAPQSGRSPHAQVIFTDAAADLGLEFTTTYGDTFAVLGLYPFPVSHVYQRGMGTGGAVGDYDSDGDLDVLMLGQLNRPNGLFRNNLAETGTADFTNVTPPELADTGQSRIAHFADMDNDDILDLIILNDDDDVPGRPPSRIMKGNGDGTFTDVSAASGFRPIGYFQTGCAIADFDQDGLLDIYTTNWGLRSSNPQPLYPGRNRLYRNLGGMTFAEVTQAGGPGDYARDSYTAIFHDMDDDSLPDIFVAVDFAVDKLWRNTGSGFADISAAANVVHVAHDMGADIADFDNDGDPDLYTTSITNPQGEFGSELYNALYVNERAQTGTLRFENEAVARGVGDTYWGWGTVFVDVENDGDLDLVSGTGMDELVLGHSVHGAGSAVYQTPYVLFVNSGAGNFTRLTGTGLDAPDDTRGLIAFDFDRDGDTDLLSTNMDQPARLFENLSENQGAYLNVILSPDRHAAGATVFATAGGVTRRREVMHSRSYVSGFPTEAHFGLGGAALVDQLLVRWNDGTEAAFANVPVNATIRICRSGVVTEICGGAAAPTPTPAGCCPGDADGSDGLIDALDFIAVQAAFGSESGIGGPGDADCSGGMVDALDFIAVQAAFGSDCG